MTLLDIEPPAQGPTGEIGARIPGVPAVRPQSEIDKQFSEIVTDPPKPFISQGFVSGIETQLHEHYLFVNKARFEAHLPPINFPPDLAAAFQALIEGVKDDPYIDLSVRVGRQAVRPFVILDNIATPAKNPLQQGSSIRLLEFNPNVIRPHTESEHPRPHAHAGSYGTHLPVAWIGRILGDEGNLELRSVKPRIGTRVIRDVSLDNV